MPTFVIHYGYIGWHGILTLRCHANVSILRRFEIYGRATSKKIQDSLTSSFILPRRGRMKEEVKESFSQEAYPNHSVILPSFPRRSTSSSFFLLPVALLPPLQAKPRFAQSCARQRCGCVFLAVSAILAESAKNITGRVAAFRRGAFSGPCFWLCFFLNFFLKITFLKIKIYF